VADFSPARSGGSPRINPTIAELTRAIEQQAEKCPAAQRLMTHPGVGALTATAFVLITGKADRFGRCKQIATDVSPHGLWIDRFEGR
jgi:transposase